LISLISYRRLPHARKTIFLWDKREKTHDLDPRRSWKSTAHRGEH
jgi:hypothetical protein